MKIEIRQVEDAEKQICEFVMRSLPDWFGIESAVHQYLEDIKSMPTFLGTCKNSWTIKAEQTLRGYKTFLLSMWLSPHRGT